MTRIYTDLKIRENLCNPRSIHFFLVLACPGWVVLICWNLFAIRFL